MLSMGRKEQEEKKIFSDFITFQKIIEAKLIMTSGKIKGGDGRIRPLGKEEGDYIIKEIETRIKKL